jgi:2-polyprenyl-3-methyl-5-hydroxy-6-metoxy-1,4-benzoquinol methylase
MSSVEEASHLEQVFPGAKFVQNAPGSAFPFQDKEFDILFCSAVLEHVGPDADQRFFVSECLRVANKVFLTTPNKNFPIEFHTFLPFLHYLPQRVHQKALHLLGMDFYAKTENLNLLTRKKLRSMPPLVPDNGMSLLDVYVTVNRLCGLPTNLILYAETSRPPQCF